MQPRAACARLQHPAADMLGANLGLLGFLGMLTSTRNLGIPKSGASHSIFSGPPLRIPYATSPHTLCWVPGGGNTSCDPPPPHKIYDPPHATDATPRIPYATPPPPPPPPPRIWEYCKQTENMRPPHTICDPPHQVGDACCTRSQCDPPHNLCDCPSCSNTNRHAKCIAIGFNKHCTNL